MSAKHSVLPFTNATDPTIRAVLNVSRWLRPAILLVVLASLTTPAGAQELRVFDYGDAPDSYHQPSTPQGSPAHHIVSQYRLGALIDDEPAQQASPNADGDDLNNTDDEDGVSVTPNPLVQCGEAVVVPVVNGAGYFSAWMDFNGDGAFSHGLANEETIVYNQPVGPGLAQAGFKFRVPCTSVSPAVARFRYDVEGYLQPNNTSDYIPLGEVEDYTFTVTSGADLLITKTDNKTTIPAGSQNTYDLAVKNLGPLTAVGNSVIDTLPSGVSFVSSAPVVCTPAGQILTCPIADLPKDAIIPFSITVAVAQNTSGELLNIADVTSTTTDPNLLNNHAEDLTIVTTGGGFEFGDADAAYTQVARHTVAAMGPLRIGSLVDTEGGHQASPNANADDLTDADDEDGIVLPPLLGTNGRVALTARPSGAGYLSAWIDTNTSNTWDPGEQIFTDEYLPGDTATRVSFDVPGGAGAATTARFRFSSDTQLAPDGAASDGEVEDYFVSFSTGADLAIEKKADPNPVCENGVITYTLTVTNLGPAKATGVTVTDTPGPGLTIRTGVGEIVQSSGACGVAGGVLTCNLGSIEAGSVVVISYRANVTSAAGTVVTNTATVASTSFDPNGGNDTWIVAVPVQSCPIRIEKFDSRDPVIVGETFSYMILVTNPAPPGGPALLNVKVTDVLPAQTTFLSATASGAGQCAITPNVGVTGTVECTWSSIAAQQTVTLTIKVYAAVELNVSECMTVLNVATARAVGGGGLPVGPVSASEDTRICSRCSVDVVLVFDRTGSMGDPFSQGGGQKLQGAKDAAILFHNRMKDPEDNTVYIRPSQLGVVSFAVPLGGGDPVTVDAKLTHIRQRVQTAISGLVAGGGTNTAVGMAKAVEEMLSIRHRPSNASVVVFFSDGANSNPVNDQPTKDIAEAAKRGGIRIVSIGVDPPNQATSDFLESLASPGLYYEAHSAGQMADIYKIVHAQVCGNGSEGEEACGDLGDAPDSTNHFSELMTAYSGPPVLYGAYPSVYDSIQSSPIGPRHKFAQGDIYLGQDVTCEDEADIGPDEDNVTNIVPELDLPNLDREDEGITTSLALPYCMQTQFQYTVTVVQDHGPAPRFVNAWMDFNRDGDWQDTITCQSGMQQVEVAEWVVQNHVVALPDGTHILVTPPFHAAPPVGNPRDMWMRLMISEQPAIGDGQGGPPDGRGPLEMFDFGETEDYILLQDPVTGLYTAD